MSRWPAHKWQDLQAKINTSIIHFSDFETSKSTEQPSDVRGKCPAEGEAAGDPPAEASGCRSAAASLLGSSVVRSGYRGKSVRCRRAAPVWLRADTHVDRVTSRHRATH